MREGLLSRPSLMGKLETQESAEKRQAITFSYWAPFFA